MAFEFTAKQTEMIDAAYYMWLTTVRADGTPQPTPVWFIRENDTFLVFSMPKAQKLKNIRQNAKVSLSFARDDEGEEFVVIMGDAVIDDKQPPLYQDAAYVEKYAGGIKRLTWTPESMADMYSVAIRIMPTQVRLSE